MLGANATPAAILLLISMWADPDLLVDEGRPASLGIDGGAFDEELLALDRRLTLPEQMLTKVDRATMATGLEARPPLLDPRVVAIARMAPLSAHVRDAVGKQLLRGLVPRLIDPALLDRPKMGFDPPVGAWLRGPLRSWADELLQEDALRASGISGTAEVARRWSRHLSGASSEEQRLWTAPPVPALVPIRARRRQWQDVDRADPSRVQDAGCRGAQGRDHRRRRRARAARVGDALRPRRRALPTPAALEARRQPLWRITSLGGGERRTGGRLPRLPPVALRRRGQNLVGRPSGGHGDPPRPSGTRDLQDAHPAGHRRAASRRCGLHLQHAQRSEPSWLPEDGLGADRPPHPVGTAEEPALASRHRPGPRPCWLLGRAHHGRSARERGAPRRRGSTSSSPRPSQWTIASAPTGPPRTSDGATTTTCSATGCSWPAPTRPRGRAASGSVREALPARRRSATSWYRRAIPPCGVDWCGAW